MEWNTDFKQAPTEVDVMVKRSRHPYTQARYDASWGGGRGAFFDLHDRLICDADGWLPIRTWIERTFCDTLDKRMEG